MHSERALRAAREQYTCFRQLGGHLAVLQWARAQSCPWNKYTCSSRLGATSRCCGGRALRAARGTSTRALRQLGGHLAVLQWARAQGCPWTSTCSSAAGGGHLAVLQWARAPAARGRYTCSSAAGGATAVLQWARAQGCPWDEETLFSSWRRHLAVLQWARSELPVDEESA